MRLTALIACDVRYLGASLGQHLGLGEQLMDHRRERGGSGLMACKDEGEQFVAQGAVIEGSPI
jgi:hypothetical protein